MLLRLAGFEEGEKWKGDFKIDDVNPWEGKTSYVILAKGLSPTVLTLRKNVNLSKNETIKMLVYSVDQQNTDDIKRLSSGLEILLILLILNMTYAI